MLGVQAGVDRGPLHVVGPGGQARVAKTLALAIVVAIHGKGGVDETVVGPAMCHKRRQKPLRVQRSQHIRLGQRPGNISTTPIVILGDRQPRARIVLLDLLAQPRQQADRSRVLHCVIQLFSV